MAYLPAIGITPDSTCVAVALSTCGRMIHRFSKCSSKEMISGSSRSQSSVLMRCSILHVRVGAWRRTPTAPGQKHRRVARGGGGGEKCNTGISPNSVRDIIEYGEMG